MEKLFEDVKFPLRLPKVIEFTPYEQGDYVVENEYILCIVDLGTFLTPRFALYKWKKENNPDNIQGYVYINVESSCGISLFIPDKNTQDENMVFLKCLNKY